MSMYNIMMGGPNPYAGVLLHLVGFTDPVRQIPRLRDCYVDAENHVVVFTRTGGNNRADYEAENTALEALPGFVRTEDWETDSTFAKWLYKPPGSEKMVQQLAEVGARMDPTTKFNELMADMRADKPGPKGQAALERAKPLMEKLTQALSGGGSGVIMVGDPDVAEPENKRN